ncbi:14488_t:CDS:1, partial [Racocetra persica]
WNEEIALENSKKKMKNKHKDEQGWQTSAFSEGEINLMNGLN